MDAALWVAKTGLDAQQMRMDVISNNLANVNTTGFKRDRAVFEDLLYQNVKQAGGQTTNNTLSPTGLMLGTGVKVVATEKLHMQGNMINSQAPLDVAITGDGYFQIQMPDGTIAYSRDGSFNQNLGQLQIARFINPSGLKPIGNNLYEASQASGPVQLLQPGINGAGTLNQGSLEASNVNVVEEMVNMIETQRAYEINSKAISAVDDMLKFLNQNV